MTKTRTNKSITKKKVGLLLSTDRDSVNILKTANSWLDSDGNDSGSHYTTLALTRKHIPTTTKNLNK